LAWSSDVQHHDGDDVWRAIETMQKYGLPVEHQGKFLGASARRVYKVQTPPKFVRERTRTATRLPWRDRVNLSTKQQNRFGGTNGSRNARI
jgi:hypothetical protein